MSYFKNYICKFMQVDWWCHKLFHFHLSFWIQFQVVQFQVILTVSQSYCHSILTFSEPIPETIQALSESYCHTILTYQGSHQTILTLLKSHCKTILTLFQSSYQTIQTLSGSYCQTILIFQCPFLRVTATQYWLIRVHIKQYWHF